MESVLSHLVAVAFGLFVGYFMGLADNGERR